MALQLLKRKGLDSEVEVSLTDNNLFTCHRCPLRLGRDFSITGSDLFINHLLVHRKKLGDIPESLLQQIKYGKKLVSPRVKLALEE